MALCKQGVLAHLHANVFCMTINVRVQNDVRVQLPGLQTHTNVCVWGGGGVRRLAAYRKHRRLRSGVAGRPSGKDQRERGRGQ